MQSETRVNLIFIVVLLILTVPGGIILFRKKLDPDSRILGMPDPVPVTVAYMVRDPTPPGKTRISPPKTARWLRQELESRIPPEANLIPLGDDSLPLISENRRFQVAAVAEDKTRQSAWVVVWDRTITPAEIIWTYDAADKEIAAEAQFAALGTAKAESLPLPANVRVELGENGLLVPPKSVLLERIDLGQIAPGGRLMLRAGPKHEIVDKIILAELALARDK